MRSEREHVTPYIKNNTKLFKMYNITHDGEDLSRMRWTVDTHEDFIFAKKIFSKLGKGGNIFYLQDIVNLLNRFPKLIEINKGITRDEGYKLSVKSDDIYS